MHLKLLKKSKLDLKKNILQRLPKKGYVGLFFSNQICSNALKKSTVTLRALKIEEMLVINKPDVIDNIIVGIVLARGFSQQNTNA